MTKQEKLKKIIEKAVKNGYIPPNRLADLVFYISDPDEFLYSQYGRPINHVSIYNIIFSLEFGLAYFGEEEVCENTGDKQSRACCGISGEFGDCESAPRWIPMQRQLLTEIQEGKDPIDYLYKFI